MGLNVATIKYLQIIEKKFGVKYKNLLMLGRQRLIISDDDLQDICTYAGYTGNIGMIRRNDEFSENLFRILFNADKIDSLDYSNYENATILSDLNEPVSSSYEELYDIVLDGGTLEHIFNFPIALKNAMCMCKKGGVLVLMTPTTGYNGHGFYQFSPELFVDALNTNGFSILDMSLCKACGNENYLMYRVSSIYDEKLNSKSECTLCICAKKIDSTPAKLIVQQGIWIDCWENRIKMPQYDYKKGGIEFYDLDRELTDQNKLSGKSILLYGAGYICSQFLKKVDEEIIKLNCIKIVGIADKNAEEINSENFSIPVKQFNNFNRSSYDYVIVSVADNLQDEITRELVIKYKYKQERILLLEEFLYYLNPKLY